MYHCLADKKNKKIKVKLRRQLSLITNMQLLMCTYHHISLSQNRATVARHTCIMSLKPPTDQYNTHRCSPLVLIFSTVCMSVSVGPIAWFIPVIKGLL